MNISMPSTPVNRDSTPPTGFCIRRQESVNDGACWQCFLDHPQLHLAHRTRARCVAAHLLTIQPEATDTDIDRVIIEETIHFAKKHEDESILWRLLDRWEELIPMAIAVLDEADETDWLVEAFHRYFPDSEPAHISAKDAMPLSQA
jgi:hypothetical protein